MDHKAFIEIINQREQEVKEKVNKSFGNMIEDEYVLDSLYVERVKNLDKNYAGERNSELFNKMVTDELPVRKTKDFDISKHAMDERMYLHKHTFIEVDYVYKGSCKYFIGSDEKFITFAEKQICLINQNMIHGIEVSDEDSIIIKCMIPFRYLDIKDYMQMDKDSPLYRFLNQSISQIAVSDGFLLYQIDKTEIIDLVFHHLFLEFANQEIGWRQRLTNDISNLLIELFRLEPSQLIYMIMEDEKVLNMAKIVSYIKTNYKDITLKGLAEDLHFHENYLGMKIKSYLKKSFQDYLKEVRLEEAKRLLRETSMSANAIAIEIGYKTPSFFYKAFKEVENITPLQYRKNYKMN